MKDFGILMFNPQPEPPARPGGLTTTTDPAQPQTYYEYKLKNVMITSIDVSGS